jgi:hypothetical protein
MRLSPLLLLLIGLFAVALNTVHGKEEEDETVFAEESVSDDKEATVEVVVNHLLPDNPFNST